MEDGYGYLIAGAGIGLICLSFRNLIMDLYKIRNDTRRYKEIFGCPPNEEMDVNDIERRLEWYDKHGD